MANAGIATGGPLRLVAPETVEETIDVNLLGVWRTARAALPHVLERRGHLLLVASAAAVLPSAGLGAYSGLEGRRGRARPRLRLELRPHGVSLGVGVLPVPAHADGGGRGSLAYLRRDGQVRMPSPLGPRGRSAAVERTVAAIGSAGGRSAPIRRSCAGDGRPRAVRRRGCWTGARGLDPGDGGSFAAEAERIGADAATCE